MEKINNIESRPWGHFELLADESDHKVKRIIVFPDKRLSLQRHKLRSEHWFFIFGDGIVTLDNNEKGDNKGGL